jgi:DNA-binding response OmpR family regulator
MNPSSHRLRVLIVDDNHDLADSQVQLVQLYGHEARAAYDGASALCVASSYQPQLVLLDIGLPDTTGFELAPRPGRGSSLCRDTWTPTAKTGGPS